MEAVFWLSFWGLLLVDWRREAVSQLLWSDKDSEVWFFLEKNHEKVYRFGLHQFCETALAVKAQMPPTKGIGLAFDGLYSLWCPRGT